MNFVFIMSLGIVYTIAARSVTNCWNKYLILTGVSLHTIHPGPVSLLEVSWEKIEEVLKCTCAYISRNTKCSSLFTHPHRKGTYVVLSWYCAKALLENDMLRRWVNVVRNLPTVVWLALYCCDDHTVGYLCISHIWPHSLTMHGSPYPAITILRRLSVIMSSNVFVSGATKQRSYNSEE